MMSRYLMTFIIQFLTTITLLVGCSSKESESNPPPLTRPKTCPNCNIILITFDALRADHMGVYGYKRNTSPNLDMFSKSAYVFTDVLSQSGTTLMSFPSMFTSRFTVTDKLYSRKGRIKLSPDQRTWVQVLKVAGYNTGGLSSQLFTNPNFEYMRGMDVFDTKFNADETAEQTLKRGLAVLEKLSEPFFLWIHFMPPHHPYKADPKVFAEFFKSAPNEPTILNTSVSDLVAHYAADETKVEFFAPSKRDLTPSVLGQIIAHYDGHIRKGDDTFGVLMQSLRQRGLTERSIIAVGADHGEDLGEHKYIGHNRLTKASLHVPLMIRTPQKTHAVLSRPAMNVDIFPTLLGLANVTYNHTIRGGDLFDPKRPGGFQLAEYHDKRAIKKGPYLYVEHHPEARLEPGQPARISLFNLQVDPSEKKNLANQLPKKVAELSRIANSLKPLSASPNEADAGSALAPQSPVIEKLKKLGYIK